MWTVASLPLTVSKTDAFMHQPNIMLLVRATRTHYNDNKGRKDIQQSTKVSLETFAGPPANIATPEKLSLLKWLCMHIRSSDDSIS